MMPDLDDGVENSTAKFMVELEDYHALVMKVF